MNILQFLVNNWFGVLILGGALVYGITAIVGAVRGEHSKDTTTYSTPLANRRAAGDIQDGDDVATLRAWAEQNAATIIRLQDRVDELTARLESVEGVLRDVG